MLDDLSISRLSMSPYATYATAQIANGLAVCHLWSTIVPRGPGKYHGVGENAGENAMIVTGASMAVFVAGAGLIVVGVLALWRQGKDSARDTVEIMRDCLHGP